jgi:hypothetical protein
MVFPHLIVLTVGDVRHHDLRISHPCPTTPRSCPPPLISYKQYHIELTTLTMTKANPMYLIVGGSHPHAFLHDRRMIGRDMQNEWGNISWNSEATTQVLAKWPLSDGSVSDDSLPTEDQRHHDVACISQLANSPMHGRMNSWVHGPLIQYSCSIFTTLQFLHENLPLEQNPSQNPILQNPQQLVENGNVPRPDETEKKTNKLLENSNQVQVHWTWSDNLLPFENQVFPLRPQLP